MTIRHQTPTANILSRTNGQTGKDPASRIKPQAAGTWKKSLTRGLMCRQAGVKRSSSESSTAQPCPSCVSSVFPKFCSRSCHFGVLTPSQLLLLIFPSLLRFPFFSIFSFPCQVQVTNNPNQLAGFFSRRLEAVSSSTQITFTSWSLQTSIPPSLPHFVPHPPSHLVACRSC